MGPSMGAEIALLPICEENTWARRALSMQRLSH